MKEPEEYTASQFWTFSTNVSTVIDEAMGFGNLGFKHFCNKTWLSAYYLAATM